MEMVELGPLQAIVTPAFPQEGITRDVVLLHGFGAPGTDLVGLAAELRVPGTRFIFLQAPHVLDGMTGPHAGRAWWHIDMIALQVARMTGQDDLLSRSVPDGLDQAREALEAAFVALEQQHGLDSARTYVGGFSQGAMLSCDWTLRGHRPLAGLIQLSGTVICEEQWKQLAPGRSSLRVFQSHSPEDPILPYALAVRLGEMLDGAGLLRTFVPFRGGHGIGPQVLSELSRFLL